jgi:hypothetical protein
MTPASRRHRPAKAMHAPVDLDTIKDDLGIPHGDTSQDEWLQRRIDGVLAPWSRTDLTAWRCGSGMDHRRHRDRLGAGASERRNQCA